MANIHELCIQFFNSEDAYEIFGVSSGATAADVRKAYYKLSLKFHPDRVSAEEKKTATEKFKVVNLIHSILTDPEKRAVYDSTGILDVGDLSSKTVASWKNYWNILFKDVTPESIDDYEKTYKGSKEETEDLKNAYLKSKGNMDIILEYVLFGHPDEEERYAEIINQLIDNEEVPVYKAFTNEPKSKKENRKRKYAKEAKSAAKVDKKKKKQEESAENDLMLAIRQRQAGREQSAESFFSHLEEKYGAKKSKTTKKK